VGGVKAITRTASAVKNVIISTVKSYWQIFNAVRTYNNESNNLD
jgi:hypothetical protein